MKPIWLYAREHVCVITPREMDKSITSLMSSSGLLGILQGNLSLFLSQLISCYFLVISCPFQNVLFLFPPLPLGLSDLRREGCRLPELSDGTRVERERLPGLTDKYR